MLNQWEPIETAPKDGSLVLVGEWILDVVFSYNVAFFQTDKLKGKKGKWYDLSSDEILNPTHWTRLPAPYPLIINGKQNG